MLQTPHTFLKWILTLALYLLANNSKTEAQLVMIQCLCVSKQTSCKREHIHDWCWHENEISPVGLHEEKIVECREESLTIASW